MTHFSDTIVATSRNTLSSATCLSLSETCRGESGDGGARGDGDRGRGQGTGTGDEAGDGDGGGGGEGILVIFLLRCSLLLSILPSVCLTVCLSLPLFLYVCLVSLSLSCALSHYFSHSLSLPPSSSLCLSLSRAREDANTADAALTYILLSDLLNLTIVSLLSTDLLDELPYPVAATVPIKCVRACLHASGC